VLGKNLLLLRLPLQGENQLNVLASGCLLDLTLPTLAVWLWTLADRSRYLVKDAPTDGTVVAGDDGEADWCAPLDHLQDEGYNSFFGLERLRAVAYHPG
jgi:hypothetical protein